MNLQESVFRSLRSLILPIFISQIFEIRVPNSNKVHATLCLTPKSVTYYLNGLLRWKYCFNVLINPWNRHNAQMTNNKVSFNIAIDQGWPDFFSRGQNLKIIFWLGLHFSNLHKNSAKQNFFWTFWWLLRRSI
jgi:hypothetical protein